MCVSSWVVCVSSWGVCVCVCLAGVCVCVCLAGVCLCVCVDREDGGAGSGGTGALLNLRGVGLNASLTG